MPMPMPAFAYLARLVACAALLAAIAMPARAGTLQVDPIRLEIDSGRRTASLRVRNQETTPVTIRAYALTWTQANGEDRYEETQAVIASPPIFTIAGGATQLVRVGLRPQAAGGPAAYRLMIEEVPQAAPNGGIQVALRLNIPLFAQIVPGNPADLAWSASRGADGRWTIEAANRGSGHVRIEPAVAQAATGIRFGTDSHLGTVLPGSVRRWTIGAEPDLADSVRFASIRRTAGAVASQAPRGD